MKDKTLTGQWDSYRAMVLGDITDPIIISALKDAFYGGALSSIVIAQQGESSTVELVTDIGKFLLSQIESEDLADSHIATMKPSSSEN